jgi:phosphatidylinositol alpha-1,6-mannosyltransferase
MRPVRNRGEALRPRRHAGYFMRPVVIEESIRPDVASMQRPPATDLAEVLLSQRFLPEHGGSIRWMYEIYRRWPRPVEVVTHDYGRETVSDPNLRLDRRDIQLDDWGLDRPRRVARYLRMTAAIAERLRRSRRVRVHCTHAVPEVVSLLPLKALYGSRLRIVCYAAGEEILACRSSRQLRVLLRLAHGAIDTMIACSAFAAGLLEELGPPHAKVIYPGVDLEALRGAAEAGRRWREERGLARAEIVLSLGRLEARKNAASVLRAVAGLAPRRPDLHAVIAGGGPLAGALRALATDLGIGPRVTFAGAVDEPTKLALLGACDVFAMPSIRSQTDVEGFGIVFVEAGACGKPSIAGRTGGQPEAVLDGETGLVVDGASQPEVTAALERLLSDSDLRARLGTGARRRAEDLDWPKVVARTVAAVNGM